MFALALALLLLVTAGTVAYWDVGRGMASQWMTDENYAHGVLVPPIAAYFAWRLRGELAAAPLRPSAVGLAIVAGSLALLAAGTAASELFLARISLVGVVAGAILFLLGARHLRILAFPLGFLVLMVPVPAIVLNEITLPLQLVASELGELLLRAAGIAVRREGNVLELPGMRLEVAEACSGVRSIVMLLTFALAFGRWNDYRPVRMALLALATLPVAVAANAARVAATGLAAAAWGSAAAEGFLHAASGTLAFAAAAFVLLAMDRLAPGPIERRVES